MADNLEGVNFLGKRGVNAADPKNDKDVVNLRTLRNSIANFSSGSGQTSFILSSLGSGIAINNGLTGETYGIRTISGGTNISIDVLSDSTLVINTTISAITSPNYYTTGATLIGNTVFFDRNDLLSAYTIDLSSFTSSGGTVALSAITGGVLGDTIRHNGTNWIANNLLYNNGTSIGINNTSPVAPLDVSGKTRTTNFQMLSGASTGYVLTAANSSGDAYWAPSSGGGGSGATTFISNGLNTYTGGTATNPTVNISGGTFANINASGNSYFNSFSATTIFSGNTDLSLIFEKNTASNIGPGTGLFSQKLGSELQFKSLSGNNIFISSNSNSILLFAEKYWTSGSTGTSSIKAFNGSLINATGNYAVAMGYDSIASGDYSTAMGYSSAANGNFSFVYGYNNSVNGTRSVVLGGINMTGSSDDTVYVPYLNIQSANTASSSDYFLARSSTGEIKLSTLNSLSAGTLSLSAITSGVLGDTIRHNGTNWIANNLLYNNGTSIGINNTSPSALLHLSGTNNSSATYSLKINDSTGTNLFSVSNSGVLNLKNSGSIIFGSGSTPSITNSINNPTLQITTAGSTQYRFGWNTGELWVTGNLGGLEGAAIFENTSVASNSKNNILLTDAVSMYTNYGWSIGPRATGDSDYGFKIENFKTGSTIPFYISNDVNSYVGINNITPSAQLDVNGKTRTTNFQMLSGASTGYVLTAANSSGDAYWAPSSGGGGSTTYIGNGLNTYTGGTATNPTVNISGGTFDNINASGNSYFNSFSATTIFSGSTDISSLFATPAQLTSVQNGLNTYTGGTATNPTVNISGGTFANINASGSSVFTTLSAVTISGSTIYSGGTDLSTLFITNLTGVVETTGNIASFSSTGIAQIRAIATLRI